MPRWGSFFISTRLEVCNHELVLHPRVFIDEHISHSFIVFPDWWQIRYQILQFFVLPHEKIDCCQSLEEIFFLKINSTFEYVCLHILLNVRLHWRNDENISPRHLPYVLLNKLINP